MSEKEEEKETADKDIEEIVGFNIKQIKKEWREKALSGDDLKDNDLRCISTGSTKLDWALRKPFQEGSIVEIYGPNSVGKTTIALEVCANGMKMGKLCFYLDLERKLREAQLEMIEGLNRSMFTLLYPDTGEEAVNMIHEMIKNYPGCVIVLDSVGALLPEVEDAEDAEKQTRALVARLCHKMIRKVTGVCARNKCHLIFLNHLTATMAMYGKSETTHGGKAIGNRASQRIELSCPSANLIKDGEKVIGQNVRCKTIKNNVFRPFITVEVPIIYGSGIDSALDMLEFARDIGILPYKNGWFILTDESGESIRKRKEWMIQRLNEDEKFREMIKNRIESIFA